METMEYKSIDDVANSFVVKEKPEEFRLEQNVTAYKDYAERSRVADEGFTRNGRHYRSFAIIPDIVSIDILTKYGLDIHAPEFMSNPASMRKLRQIIDSDYALLKTSNIKAL